MLTVGRLSALLCLLDARENEMDAAAGATQYSPERVLMY